MFDNYHPPAKMPAFISLSPPTSVGSKISDAGDRGTPGYRREWQGILQTDKSRYEYGKFLAA